MKRKKSISQIRRRIKLSFTLVLALVMILSVITFPAKAFEHAAGTDPVLEPETREDSYTTSLWPQSVEILWEPEEKPDPFIAPPPMTLYEEDVILTVSYAAASIERAFSLSEIEPLMLENPVTFSNYSTFPSYGTNNNVPGVRVIDLLAAAGIPISSLDPNQSIGFSAGGGYTARFTVEQLFEPRFFFSSDGTKGAQVPAIIAIDPSESSYPRNFYGQAYAGEQTRNTFVQNMTHITIGTDAGIWAEVTATPVSGSQINPGDLIRLTSASAAAGAKIHYTLDGSEPTRDSAMYNLIADGWLVNHGLTENTPITVPSGASTLVIKAFASGTGKADSATRIFTYSVTGASSSKQERDPPTGLSGGVLLITGTSSDMEYHTNAAAANGWVSCSNSVTPVQAGTYYVRFKETATHKASSGVRVTVTGKPAQSPPTGLSAGTGVIYGTTIAMEYNTSPSATSGWRVCSEGSTLVDGGTYYIRFGETETHSASETVRLNVGSEKGETILSVNTGSGFKEFTQKDIDSLSSYGPYTYSSYNTWPNYMTLTDITGTRIMDILAASGVANLSSGQGIRFTSSDGYSAVVTVGQLEQPRYYYTSNGARGSQLPSMICFSTGENYRRLVFGQAAVSEQINPSFVKDVVRIDVEGSAGSWGVPSVSPESGSPVKKGDSIRLSMPAGQGDAKIYYTLDGSVPTRDSAIYNTVADRWLSQKGMDENTPISAPDGSFVVRARILGTGKNDGQTIAFSFSGEAAKDLVVSPEIIFDFTVGGLESGNVSVEEGGSFFVPAEEGSIVWNEDEMDGYYDAELGGYVFTPKPGFEGIINFKYIDKDGVEHDLSVQVGAESETLVSEKSAVYPIAGSGISSGPSTESDAADRRLSQTALIIICIAGSAAGGALGALLPSVFKNYRSRKAMGAQP